MPSESWTSEHRLFVLTVSNFCSNENKSYHCIRQSGTLLCIPEKVSFVTNSVCVCVCMCVDFVAVMFDKVMW